MLQARRVVRRRGVTHVVFRRQGQAELARKEPQRDVQCGEDAQSAIWRRRRRLLLLLLLLLL